MNEELSQSHSKLKVEHVQHLPFDAVDVFGAKDARGHGPALVFQRAIVVILREQVNVCPTGAVMKPTFVATTNAPKNTRSKAQSGREMDSNGLQRVIYAAVTNNMDTVTSARRTRVYTKCRNLT